jgi:hypothetical protein
LKDKEYYKTKYRRAHETLNSLELEIEKYIENKEDIIQDDEKIKDLKKKVIEAVEELNKIREDERRFFN